jgi:hypothetical protein
MPTTESITGTRATSAEAMVAKAAGEAAPSPIPTRMQSATQSERYRSNVDIPGRAAAAVDEVATSISLDGVGSRPNLPADNPEPVPQLSRAQVRKRKSYERRDTALKVSQRRAERLMLPILVDGGWIINAPARVERRPWPDRTRLTGGIVADGVHKVYSRCSRPSKLAPAF